MFKVWGLGFGSGVWGLEFWLLGLGSGFGSWGFGGSVFFFNDLLGWGFGVWSVDFGVHGLGFRVWTWGLGYEVMGSGCRVYGQGFWGLRSLVQG